LAVGAVAVGDAGVTCRGPALLSASPTVDIEGVVIPDVCVLSPLADSVAGIVMGIAIDEAREARLRTRDAGQHRHGADKGHGACDLRQE
jgi:hypothetical protein